MAGSQRLRREKSNFVCLNDIKSLYVFLNNIILFLNRINICYSTSTIASCSDSSNNTPL